MCSYFIPNTTCSPVTLISISVIRLKNKVQYHGNEVSPVVTSHNCGIAVIVTVRTHPLVNLYLQGTRCNKKQRLKGEASL